MSNVSVTFIDDRGKNGATEFFSPPKGEKELLVILLVTLVFQVKLEVKYFEIFIFHIEKQTDIY